MAEFLGARISLVSKSDIRYVGTLHEINSVNSTVALENVSSFGTENRKENAEDYIPPSDSVYEYIVFRGSDVKDLRIEQTPAVKENKPPQVPNDPAILGSGSRPTPQPPSQAPQPQRQPSQGPSQQGQGPPPQQGVPPFAQHPQYPPFYPPPPAGWGRAGPPPPGPGGFPPMPYGAPPGWYPGPGGFPPGPFPPYGYPPGPPGQFPPPPQNQNQGPKPAPIGPSANKQHSPPATTPSDKPAEPKNLAGPAAEMAAAAVKAPPPPTATKPSPNEVQAAIDQPSTAQVAAKAASKATPTGPKNNRVTPAIPLQSPAVPKALLQRQANNAQTLAAKPVDTDTSLRDATQAATAAVAAAMAKLPTGGQMNGNGADNLTKKVNEMRVNDPIRAPRHPGAAGAGFPTSRGGRGGRGGARNAEKKVDVPESDFDFESANAKFNKQDLVKEAIAGSPIGETPPAVASPTEPDAPVSGYNKSTSFFDNISSESKDRMEASAGRPGGREWRGEEQKKNVETFGQGSVDNGYRGGYRGRGRGRAGYRGGRGYSGNGQPGRGRGGYRGQGDAQTAV